MSQDQGAGSAWDVLEGVNLPRGYRVEITDGKIIMTPRGESHRAVVRSAAAQLEQQLAGRGTVLADAMVDFPSARSGYAPDLTVVAPGAERNGRGRFAWHDLEAVIEVVPPSGRDHDHVTKVRTYGGCGIPLYVVVDQAEAVCTVHSAPQRTGGYREAERVPFGNDVFLPSADRTLVLSTDDFPVDPA
ncbi:Uma2 family endonuclease [Streptomyces sp. BE20]|uniref:Uma2 family endonuclease n=1 Tax=unclassified Streptomyces TaxID=2593676 RepID=UPI002E76C10E|nr:MULTISPECIES: Uma2 family endonuclease [unclassified Streptomyces]MED7954136.1 Uma2 family endonuclease [Streptomyces sp. BE303]MEE1825915.1 Uma2 family endonuclease [Streptomyces sp. BE20]